MGDSVMAEEMIFQREDLEEQLFQRFPWLKEKDSNSMVACFVGVGWFTLLSDMFLEIENHYSSLNEPLDTIDFVKIYEKFGGLRVFMFEYPHGIGEIITKYEDLSFRVCEICGDIGELRDGEWNYVVCDNCMFKHKKNAKLKSLPPTKFKLGDKVRFTFDGVELTGIIEIVDFGGSLEHDYHSYDICSAEDDCLYKHIPERDCKIAE